jgi:hypothetical protein
MPSIAVAHEGHKDVEQEPIGGEFSTRKGGAALR